MGLKIISAAEPIVIETIVMVIYSPPGLGKTSTAYTAQDPLLLDTDAGSHRSGFRKDTVRPASWEEIAGITGDDVKPYNTLVLDTAGRALDLLSVDIIAKNPKMGRGGALTLQGYGQLKSDFTAYLNLMRSFGLDIVLIAHSDEKQQGDETIERIDMQGGSKQEVYKSADAMGRILIDAGKRYLSFSPTDTAFGKDPAQLGRIEIPDFNKEPLFLAGVISRIKETLNAATAAQAEAVAALEEWKAEVAAIEDPAALTAKIADAGQDRPKKMAILEAAEARGWTFDKEKKAFVAPEAEKEPEPEKPAKKKAAAKKEPEPAAEAEPEAEKEVEPEAPAEDAQEAAPEAAEAASTAEGEQEAPAITDKQRKRFYAIAKGAGYSDEGITAMLLDRLGVGSSRDLTRANYEEACDLAADDELAASYVEEGEPEPAPDAPEAGDDEQPEMPF